MMTSVELHFKIAKHYWLGGKNATWSVSDYFDRDILKWVKDQYSKFEKARPSYEMVQSKTVFLFYTDTKDVYGRKITEILAVLVNASFRSIEHINKLVADKLSALSPSSLDFSLVVDDSYVSSIQRVSDDRSKSLLKSRTISALMISSGLAILTVVVLLLFVNRREHPQLSSDNVVTQPNYSKDDSVHRVKTSPSPAILQKDIAEPSPEGVRDQFCRKFRQMQRNNLQNQVGERCFLSYIEDQCANPNDRRSYGDWIQDNRSVDGCEYVKDPEKDQDLKSWKDGHPEIKNLIRDFFSGKE